MFSKHQTPGGTRPSWPIGILPLPLAKPMDNWPITVTIDGAKITIKFDPNKSKKIRHADWINFHQTMRISVVEESIHKPKKSIKPGDLVPEWKVADRWTTSNNWFVDQYDSNQPSYYVYYLPDKGRYTNGKSQAAIMQDEPGFTIDGLDLLRKLLYHKDKNPGGKYTQLHWKFYTFAVCEVGRDKAIPQWYEGVSWFWGITAAKFYSNEPGSWRGEISFGDHYYNSAPIPEEFIAAVGKYRSVSGRD